MSCPAAIVTVAVTRRSPPAAAAATGRVRPTGSTPATTPATLDADLFNAQQRLSGKAAAGRRAALRLRHAWSSTTARCRWCIPTTSSTKPICDKLPLVEPVYPLTAGLGAQAVCAARSDGALTKLPDAAGMAGRGVAARAALSAVRGRADALAPSGRARSTSQPDSPAWSRLAYDELLAGQLALALVRAHHAQPARPRQRRRRRLARARSSPRCPIR